VPDGAHPEVVTDLALRDVGRLVRDLHRAVVGFELPSGQEWHFGSLSGPGPHLVCHHDLSPKNTVFRGGRAVAFIDWDMATLEAPIHDVVHAAWQFVPLLSDEECGRQGWSRPPERGRRLRLLLDAYGLADGSAKASPQGWPSGWRRRRPASSRWRPTASPRSRASPRAV
jgi:hypothetical protein